MTEISTYTKVYSVVKDDLKAQGLTLDQASEMLGYKSRQSLYNLFSAKQFMKPEQANRFVQTFGYSYDYLTCGRGSLHLGEDGDLRLAYIKKCKHSELKLKALVCVATSIIYYLKNPHAQRAWSAINNKDQKTFLSEMQELINEQDCEQPSTNDYSTLGRIYCSKDLDELIHVFGILDESQIEYGVYLEDYPN